MNRPTLPPDDSFESDAVWKLLDEAPPKAASPSFTDDVVRMARMMPEHTPWWKRLVVIGPISGLASAAAAIALGVILWNPSQSSSAPTPPVIAEVSTVAADGFEEIQDRAETETLLAAADHLEDFSDQELASLIGF